MGRPRRGVARVLICDFDFFSTIGGGQVFYRRVVERNPDLDFFYPSRARDLALKSSGRLPGNAHPFLVGATAGEETRSALDTSLSPAALRYAEPLAIVAAAVRGQTFDVADFPSFFPAAHLARPMFARFGITARRIVVSMMGWNSVSCRAAYEDLDELADALEAEETACADGADVLYTISQLEQTLHRRGASPVQHLACTTS